MNIENRSNLTICIGSYRFAVHIYQVMHSHVNTAQADRFHEIKRDAYEDIDDII